MGFVAPRARTRCCCAGASRTVSRPSTLARQELPIHMSSRSSAQRAASSRKRGAAARRVATKTKPPISIKSIAKFLSREGNDDKVAVVVGSVTDDVRFLEVPKMTVCALRFTTTARARILKAGGECLTLDQLALRSPEGENTLLLRGCKSRRESAKH